MEQTNGVNAVVKPVDSATKLSQLGIGPWVYFNGHHRGSPADLMEGPPGNLAGYSIFPLTSGFNNNPSFHKEGWDGLMAFSYNPTVYTDNNGHTWAVVRTTSRVDAYRIEDLLEYGAVDNPDNAANRFKGWLEATEGHAIEYVKPNPVIGYIEGEEFIPDYSRYGMTTVKGPIKPYEATLPINDFGKFLSMKYNFDKDLRDAMQRNYFFEGVGLHKDTEAFIEFLLEKGLGSARVIDGVGVKKIPSVARTYSSNGTAALVVPTDFYKKALEIAQAYGMGDSEEAVKFAKRATIWHELIHVMDHRKGLSERDLEAGIGDLLYEFLSQRASEVDEKTAKYYRALAEENRHYAWGWRLGLIRSSRGKSVARTLENLAEQYASEARALRLNEKEAGDYVVNKLEQTLKETEESGLEERVQGSKGSKGENSKNEKYTGKTNSKYARDSDKAEEQAEQSDKTEGDVTAEDGDGAESSGEE